jgi:hypothetical protein
MEPSRALCHLLAGVVPRLLVLSGMLAAALPSAAAHAEHAAHPRTAGGVIDKASAAVADRCGVSDAPTDPGGPGAPRGPHGPHGPHCALCVASAAPVLAGAHGTSVPRLPVELVSVERVAPDEEPLGASRRLSPPGRGPPSR